VALTGWLVDKSALARLGQSSDGDVWAQRIARGTVSICTVTRLEVGYSARSAADLRELLRTAPLAALIVEHFTPAIEERALEVQLILAERGQHRAPSLADLLIAATAELRKLTVLHFDKDFDLIAETTGQPAEWLRV
jgi:predicted nucleic acid-binding protein